MSDVIYIGAHMAYMCDCGSVHYNLLRSGKIECSNCQKINNNWCTDAEKMLIEDALAHIVICKVCHKKHIKRQSNDCPYCEIDRYREALNLISSGGTTGCNAEYRAIAREALEVQGE